MLKKIIYSALACLAVAGCAKNTCTITGVVEDPALEGAKVYRIPHYDVTDASVKPVYDSTVVENGKFTFTFDAPEDDYCTVTVSSEDASQNGESAYAYVVFSKGDKITVSVDSTRETTVTGNPLSEKLAAFEKSYSKAYDEIMPIYARYRAASSDEEKEALEAQIDSLSDMVHASEYDFVKENINNPAGWVRLYNASVRADGVDKMKELIAGAEGKTTEIPEYKEITSRIEALENTAVGKKFIDLTMDDPDGNKISLSDFAGKGNYVLIDFWASWCGPCKNESPNVVAMYNQYKDKGFDIVGISFDSTKDRWTSAITEWGMPWHQMSDLKGWDSEGAKAYAVTGIPHTVLLDKDGIIIANDLRGESLKEKLAELLK